MRKTIFFILIFISILALALRFGSKPLTQALGINERSGLRVEASQQSKVFINNQEVGETPFQKEDLSPTEYLVEIKNDKTTWQGYIKLGSGTLSVINRELAEDKSAQSGDMITLEKGKGAIIITNPSNSKVEIDGRVLGNTPLKVEDLSAGEHLFLISQPNFLKRSVRAVATDGYNLNLVVDLAVAEVEMTTPVPKPISQVNQAIVRSTPVGFLRIRSSASINSKEVGRVSPGDSVTILEEVTGWTKIRTDVGLEGYVSSQYLQKKTP